MKAYTYLPALLIKLELIQTEKEVLLYERRLLCRRN